MYYKFIKLFEEYSDNVEKMMYAIEQQEAKVNEISPKVESQVFARIIDKRQKAMFETLVTKLYAIYKGEQNESNKNA